MGLGASLTLCAAGGAIYATVGRTNPAVAYIYTEAPRFDAQAWQRGADRFSAGATLKLVSGSSRRSLAPGFAASADAAVSFDGTRVLFSGKRTGGLWQIWEVDLAGGEPRQIVESPFDCIRPLYLPEGQIVYTRVAPEGSDLQLAPKTGQLTFAPGRYLTNAVLRDGRILFTHGRELMTVYPDGTGVEALRCDHGPERGDAIQLASGDYIFRSEGRLARITSALATQTDVAQPEAAGAGPIAEISPGLWLVSLRGGSGHLGLYRWNAAKRTTEALELPANASAVEPVIVAPRPVPRQFPSALVPTRTAGNLLCLNARTSKEPLEAEAVQTVRVYAREGLLGQVPVESDGSFYIQVPADRPIRLELADAAGRTVRAEHGWFWMRASEQRICIGCHTGPERAPENRVPEILLKTIVPTKMLEVSHP